MKLLTALAALSFIAAAAQAGIFKDKWIEATLECISYSSQMNCIKSENAASAYKRSLESSYQGDSDARECSAWVSRAGVVASSTPLLGDKTLLQKVFENALDMCKKF